MRCHVDKVALAARRSLGSLIAKSKENGGFSAQTYSYLYSTLVTPVIDYSCCVWGYEKHSPLESMQGNAMRYFLGATGNDTGRVEVCVDGTESYGTVCNDRWDVLEARVVCMQLGFSSEG